MIAALPWIGRGVVWGLSSIGLMKVGETVAGTPTDNAEGKPSVMAWLMVTGILALAIWLTFKHFKGAS